MDFTLPDQPYDFYPFTPVDNGVFLIPKEDVIERPQDDEVIVREKDNV
jgi:hypothetical protein